MAARSLSDLLQEVGVPTTVGGHLKQYGVKGMKWGVRRKSSSGGSFNSNARKPKPGKRVKKAAPKPASKMSDQELRKVIARMQMEKQYKDLSASQASTGKTIVKNLLISVGKQQANALANQAAKAAIDAALKGASKGAGNAASKLLPYLIVK